MPGSGPGAREAENECLPQGVWGTVQQQLLTGRSLVPKGQPSEPAQNLPPELSMGTGGTESLCKGEK